MIPLFWRVETESALLVVGYQISGEAYEQVAVVDGVGTAPAPWGQLLLDLAGVRPS